MKNGKKFDGNLVVSFGCFFIIGIFLFYQTWLDYRQSGFCPAIFLDILMVLVYFFVLWLIKRTDWQTGEFQSKTDRKTHKILSRQENLGNRIFNELQSIVPEGSLIKLRKIGQPNNPYGYEMLVTWGEIAYDPIVSIKISGWRVIHINVNGKNKSMNVFFYSGRVERVASKSCSLAESSIEIAISEMKSHIISWKL